MNHSVSTKFIVNENKKVVVCIITAINDVPYRLQKYGLKGEKQFWYEEGLETDIRRYVGVARCLPGDKWDERYGRKLSEYKASMKRQKTVNREIYNWAEKQTSKLADLTTYGYLKNPHFPEEEINR